MNLDTQFKIKTNQYYTKYLHQNSYWYKHLNRNPKLFDQFKEEMEIKFKQTTTDKINNAVNQIKLVKDILEILK